MKHQSSKMRKTVLRSIIPVIVIVCMLVLPGIVMGQNPGDNPDAQPQAVPLSPEMTVLLIGAGILLAMKIIKRRMAQLKPQTVNIN